MSLASKLIFILALPLVVFMSGGWIMSDLSNRHLVVKQLNEPNVNCEDRTPLNRRLGYDIEDVKRHWRALDDTALDYERIFLKLDLLFPLFYGAALAVSILMAWATLGRPFKPLWLIAPVVFTMLADWTENFIQLNQLPHNKVSEAALQAGWIQIASAATILKLLFFGVSYLLIVGLVGAMVICAFKSR